MPADGRTPVWVRWPLAARALTLGLALTLVACPPPRTDWVNINTLKELGEPRADILARGFAVARQPQPSGFGFYVYLLFSSRATSVQKLIAARAFLGHPRADQLTDQYDREKLALLLAPISLASDDPKCSRLPESANQLVTCYDLARATVITEAVEKARGERLPAVALVGYPTAIDRGTKPDPEKVLVTDACGIEQDVLIKFDRIHQAAKGNPDGQIRGFMEKLGNLFTIYRTQLCP